MKPIDPRPLVLIALLGFALAACTDRQAATRATEGAHAAGDYKIGRPYNVNGVWYYPRVDYDYRQTGIASWYGPGFHGKQTANGEIYDQMALTAAHRTLPMPSLVRVTNLDNGRSIKVRINDRGPFKNGRIIDLSYRAAQLLDFVQAGTAKVKVEILEPESRRLAAVAQGRWAAESAPEAAPMVAVQAAPLEPIVTADNEVPGGSVEQIAAAQEASRAKRGPVRPARSRRPVAAGGTGRHDADPAPTGGGTIMTHRSLAMATVGSDLDDWDFNGEAGPARTTGPAPDRLSPPPPDGTVMQLPVRRTSIYIQAGSFLRRDYATRLSARLSVLGPSKVVQAEVDKRQFFRVRLGPIATVEHADQLLDLLQSKGFADARVIVD
jgi:rare lipoprotein A